MTIARLRRIRQFVFRAETLSFRRAAERLYMAQPRARSERCTSVSLASPHTAVVPRFPADYPGVGLVLYESTSVTILQQLGDNVSDV